MLVLRAAEVEACEDLRLATGDLADQTHERLGIKKVSFDILMPEVIHWAISHFPRNRVKEGLEVNRKRPCGQIAAIQ
jgi:hypothetical protein